MSDTFSQIYIQIIFAVKYRNYLIDASWEEKLHKYISGIVTNKNQKMIAINGMPDHIHFLIGIKPSCCISDLIREIKKGSVEYIKEQKFSMFKFQWQEGYGAFSYSHSQLTNVINYINNQKEHHKHKSFKQEYIHLLRLLEMEFKAEHLFNWLD